MIDRIIRLRNPTQRTLSKKSELEQLCIKAGWTQQTLSKKLGISINTLKRYMNGVAQGYKLDGFIGLWAELINVEVSHLLKLLEEQKNNPKKETKKRSKYQKVQNKGRGGYKKLTPVQERNLWIRVNKIDKRDKLNFDKNPEETS